MKSNRFLPILVMMGLTGLGVFVGVQTILNANNSKPLVRSKQVVTDTVSGEGIAARKQQGIVAVLRGIDKENNKIGVYLTNEMKETSFSYDLATSVKSITDQELVMSELELGSILNLEFRNATEMLSKVEVNKEAWDYEGVRNLQIDEVLSKIQIGKSNYTYDAGLTVISGRDNVSLSNLDTSKDTLEVRGIGEKILSISVTTGHGVLDFLDYDEFLGGTIEIGYDVFDDITDNMKYILREGKYKVIMRNDKLSVNKVVNIKRDRTEVLRLSDFAEEMSKSSKVTFNLSPSNAAIFIDGKEVDAERKLELDYGEYLVKVAADRYVSWEKVVTISKPRTVMGIALALIKEKTDEEEKDDGMAEPPSDIEDLNGETGNNGNPDNQSGDGGSENEEIKVRTDSTRTISFRKPEGATILFDDKVIGDAPCEMTKITGEHDITLKKDGYETQTYTVDIEDDGEDVVYSFPDMIKEN